MEVGGQISNQTNQTNYDPLACYYDGSYTKFIFFMTVLILSVLGNVLLVAVFIRNKTLRTTVNYFIANMAVSDLFIPFMYLLPFVTGITYRDNRWLLDGTVGSALCKLFYYIWHVSRFVSLFSMIFGAVDRFQAILFPFRSALITKERRLLAVLVTWIVSMTLPAHYLYGTRLVSYDRKSYCVFQWNPPQYTKDVLKCSHLLFFCTTAASAVVLTVMYSKIIRHLYKQKIILHLQAEAIKARAKQNRQITTLLVVVVIAFYAFWCPFAVQSLEWVLFKPTERLMCTANTGIIFHVIYPIINPLVCVIFNTNYREGYRELLCCCYKWEKSTVLPLGKKNVQQRETGRENKAVKTNGTVETCF